MKVDKVKFNARIQKMLAESILNIDELKASTVLDANINPEKILPHIIDVQRLILEPLIGTKLYRKLQGNNLSFEYQLLKEQYVEPFISSEAMSAYVSIGTYNLQQGGYYRHIPTQGEPLEHYETSLISKKYKYRADEYAKRMIDFIKKYPEYYKEYRECVGNGLSAKQSRRNILGGWNLQRTISPSDREKISDDLWASDTGCCGAMESSCAGGTCPPDDGIFTVGFWWGNSDEVDMGFDPTTLAHSHSTRPNSVYAQPTNDYFWIVGEIDFVIEQLGTEIPLSLFSDTDPLSEVYVKGTQDGLTWIRIKIIDTYDQQVEFGIK